MNNKESLSKRVFQFKTLNLPGQPQMMHMGTNSLVNDLFCQHILLRKALSDLVGASDIGTLKKMEGLIAAIPEVEREDQKAMINAIQVLVETHDKGEKV